MKWSIVEFLSTRTENVVVYQHRGRWTKRRKNWGQSFEVNGFGREIDVEIWGWEWGRGAKRNITTATNPGIQVILFIGFEPSQFSIFLEFKFHIIFCVLNEWLKPQILMSSRHQLLLTPNQFVFHRISRDQHIHIKPRREAKMLNEMLRKQKFSKKNPKINQWMKTGSPFEV